MLRHVFRCIMGIAALPELTSSIVIDRISDALSPMCSHSSANLHIWHRDELHTLGLREAKSLVNIDLPALCLNSTERVLSPVKNAQILELVENAPLRLRLHASTHD